MDGHFLISLACACCWLVVVVFSKKEFDIIYEQRVEGEIDLVDVLKMQVRVCVYVKLIRYLKNCWLVRRLRKILAFAQ